MRHKKLSIYKLESPRFPTLVNTKKRHLTYSVVYTTLRTAASPDCRLRLLEYFFWVICLYFLLFETPMATLWSSCAPKHAMWQRVFWGASGFKVRVVRWLLGWRYISSLHSVLRSCFIGSCHVGVSKSFSLSISLAVFCLYTLILLVRSLVDPTLAAFIVCVTISFSCERCNFWLNGELNWQLGKSSSGEHCFACGNGISSRIPGTRGSTSMVFTTDVKEET